MKWTELDEGKEKCKAVAKAVMNLRVPQNSGNYLD
jgi:hypothetical protein